MFECREPRAGRSRPLRADFRAVASPSGLPSPAIEDIFETSNPNRVSNTERKGPTMTSFALLPQASGDPTSRLRLTRRGRAVFGTLATVVSAALLALAALLGAAQAQAAGETSGAELGYVVVQSGDSLWSVAAALDPGADPRDTVAEIVRLNRLDGSGVQSGQPIAVPLRFASAAGVVSAAELGLSEDGGAAAAPATDAGAAAGSGTGVFG